MILIFLRIMCHEKDIQKRDHVHLRFGDQSRVSSEFEAAPGLEAAALP